MSYKVRKSRPDPIADKMRLYIEKHKPTTGILKKVDYDKVGATVLIDMEVTPEMAKDLIKLNLENRPLDGDIVASYVQMMKAGKWIAAGNTLKISKENILLDGQHTLMSIIESEKAQVLDIRTGIEPKAFKVMDQGKNRSAGDLLGILGYYQYNILAAAIKQSIYFHKARRLSSNISRKKVQNYEITDWVESKQNNVMLMQKCLDYAMKNLHPKSRFFAGSTWTFLFYELSRKNQTEAEQFVRLLATGEGITSTGRHSAIYHLRNKLLDPKKLHAEKFKSGTRGNDRKVRYAIKAWNIWRSGRKIERLEVDREKSELDLPE